MARYCPTTAVHWMDDYLVIGKHPGYRSIVESHSSTNRAQHAVDVLNEHELRAGRLPIYEYVERAK